MKFHIGHVALRVTDLAASGEHFKRVLGLRETGKGNKDEVMLSANEKHHELQLISAKAPGLDHIGLELEHEEELEAAVGVAVAAGAEVIEAAPVEDGIVSSARLVGPGGIVYEFYVGMERAGLDPGNFISEARVRRLGHLTLLCEDHAEILDFWLNGLGFRVSDEADGITWTRCDSDHHGLAIGPCPPGVGNLIHHHAWEVRDFAALGRNCDRLAADGIRLLWGPVRHGPGMNLAAYAPDLDGAVIEMYSDLLTIHDDAGYRPVDWSGEPMALNLWGPPPSDEFMKAGLPILPPVKVTA